MLWGFHASVGNNDLRGIEHAEAELCFHTLQGGKWWGKVALGRCRFNAELLTNAWHNQEHRTFSCWNISMITFAWTAAVLFDYGKKRFIIMYNTRSNSLERSYTSSRARNVLMQPHLKVFNHDRPVWGQSSTSHWYFRLYFDYACTESLHFETPLFMV